jgi:CubicO group peptidase (beta-lactamase class C family)
VRLADDAVTVRDLLAHTAGAADPAVLLAPAVPALATVTGPVIACSGKRGAFSQASAGYAALGEIIAEHTGLAYPDAVSRLILHPLGMSQSWFPQAWPAGQPSSGHTPVAGYDVAADETFTPAAGEVSVFPAAAGLWTTAADLARFGLGWPSLLPGSLAAQALRPHARQPNGIGVGLGWAVNVDAGVTGVAGEGPGAGASLLVSADGRHACAALTNRPLFIEPANGAVLQMLRGGGARVE